MSMDDKIKHEAEQSKGRLKENIGDVTDNPEMQAEDPGETSAAETQQADDKVQDAAHDVAEEKDRDR